jgi:uncharacterized protein (DUF362 family)
MATSAQTGVPSIAMLPVAVVLNQAKDRLDSAWTSAGKLYPQIFPTTLPAGVLRKPNLCDMVAWENGVTTDPSWLHALVPHLRALRPEVRIAVIESDAVGAYKTYRSCDETFERLGYLASAAELGIELLNFSKTQTFDISLPGIPYPVRIPQLFLEPFYFISVANLKVHPYEHLTGILKNSLGRLPQADIGHDHPYLPTLISALHRMCPPDLCIIDGRIGLEGKGPIDGNDGMTTVDVVCRAYRSVGAASLQSVAVS